MANYETTRTGPGRPALITPAVLEKLKTAFLMGCTDAEACAFAEIDDGTLYHYQRRNPDFLKKKDQWKLRPFLKARSTLYKSLDKAENAKWFLERKRKDEFSTKQIIEGLDKPEEEVDKLDNLASAITSLAQDVKSNLPAKS